VVLTVAGSSALADQSPAPAPAPEPSKTTTVGGGVPNPWRSPYKVVLTTEHVLPQQ